MLSNKNKYVAISIANGFQERLLVQSGFLKNLLKISSRPVRVIVPDEKLLSNVSQDLLNNLEIKVFSDNSPSFIKIYFANRRVLLWKAPFIGAVRNYFKRQRVQKGKVLMPLGIFLLRIIPFEFRLILDKTLLFNRTYKKILEGADLLIVASGFVYQDVVLAYAARKLNIPIVMIGQSWDNFSTKGYVTFKPDLLLVWGKRMAEEAIYFNGFPSKIIKIVGPLHFDFYHKFRHTCKKEKSKIDLGLHPDRVTLIYGTSSIMGCPGEIDILKKIVEWVKTSPNSIIPKHAQLIIRLHPDQVLGAYGQNVKNYLSFSSDNVLVQVPELEITTHSWIFKKNDKQNLAKALCAADVAVNCFSTFSLDAAVFDIPVISVAFDGDKKVSNLFTAKRYRNYTHIQGLLKYGGIQLAYSYKDLSLYLKDAILYPQKYSLNRKKMVEYLLNNIDGKSVERAISYIKDSLLL